MFLEKNSQEININKNDNEILIKGDDSLSKEIGKCENLIPTKNKSEDNSPLIGESINNKEYFEDKEPIFDYLIPIRYSKRLNIPYFVFGNTLHFYYPNTKFDSKIKLSEIPTPPFTIGPGCKYYNLN